MLYFTEGQKNILTISFNFNSVFSSNNIRILQSIIFNTWGLKICKEDMKHCTICTYQDIINDPNIVIISITLL